MHAAMRVCQARHDSAEPADDSAYEAAATRWIEDSAEQLVGGSDVLFTRTYGHWQGVHQHQFIARVQEHLVQRQIDGADDEDWFAQLIATAYAGGNTKTYAGYLMGPSSHPRGKMFEIAESMLEQYAGDALAAEAEDDLH